MKWRRRSRSKPSRKTWLRPARIGHSSRTETQSTRSPIPTPTNTAFRGWLTTRKPTSARGKPRWIFSPRLPNKKRTSPAWGRFSQHPAVEQYDQAHEPEQPEPGREGEVFGNQSDGRVLRESHDECGIKHAPQALPHDEPRSDQGAEPLGALGIRHRSRPVLIPVANDGSNHDRERGRHRKINADAHGQRRNAQFLERPQRGIEHDESDPHQCADAEHFPLKMLSDHALRESRNKRGLRCG